MEKQDQPLDSSRLSSRQNARGKKIILAITKSNFGGAQKYVYTLAKGLKDKGFLVKVLLGGDGILIKKLQEENIDVFRLPTLQRDISISKEIKNFWEIWKILKKEKPDIFHVNSSKIGGIGCFLGRIMGIKKVIFTTHGFAFNENRGVISKIILKLLYWLTFLFSHKTICVSQKTLEQSPKFLLPKSKFEVIYNGIEPINFLDKNEAKLKLRQLNDKLILDKKWLGTLAELHHIKGIDILIKSAKEILQKRQDVQFVIFGDGEKKSELYKQIQQSELTSNFILFGQLENAPTYLKALDLFILPSRSEAMPLAILESMYANIPIIASDVGGISEMIPKSSLIESQNINQLTQKINEKLDNYQFDNYDLNIFSLEKMLTKTIKIYT